MTESLTSEGEALLQAEHYRVAGRFSEAEALCRRVLETNPASPDAEHILGLIAYQQGAFALAVEHVRRAIALAPKASVFHANLSEMLRLTGQPQAAVEAAERALAIDPDMPAALSNLGVALYDLKAYEAAADAQRRAIAIKPDFAVAHSNLGNALHALHRYDEAIATFQRAVELEPHYADAWANLGTTLHHAGAFDEGAAAFRRAIALAPGHANAHTGLGLLLLMRGDLGEGWDEYEWRFGSSELGGARLPRSPWGGESLAGKSIYVEAEQGLGDTLQFARYIPLLVARGAHVTFRAHPRLTALLAESLPGVVVLGEGGEPGPCDCDAALLGLPRRFKTRLETIPAGAAYLRSPADVAFRWRTRLAALQGLKVGLVWAGNPEHVNDWRRSVPLSTIKPLLAARGASFASLQVGPPTDELKTLGKSARRRLEDLSPDLTDFTDTAGAVAALDLVITVDTAVAHLAGALGKPVWLLLPWVADWRWMLGREDSPWYPSLRLFRQARDEDWTAVIARVMAELEAVVQGETAGLTPFRVKGEVRAGQAAEIIAAEALRVVAEPGPVALDAAEAEHQRGIVAHQSGRGGEAIEHLRRAIAIRPDVALYHANLGEMLRLSGRPDEAIEAGRRALALDPKNPAPASNVGIALFDQGRFEEALAEQDRAIAIQPDFGQAHSNRGNTLQRLKRFEEAEQAYRRALDLQPDFADAWNNLGACLRELARPEEAEGVYRRAQALDPANAGILDNLALALKDLDRFDDAADILRQAIAIEPGRETLFLHYGAILLDQERLEEASAATERAIALNPHSHDAVNQMGRVAFHKGALDAALAYYEHALALKPDLAEAYNNMGNALKDLGRLDEAQAAFLACLEHDPDMTGAYVNLADTTRFTPGHPHLVAMEALAARDEGLSKADRIHVDFALGKAYADLKDYDRSFAHLLKGNAAKRATIDYDEAWMMALFDRIEAMFTPGFIEARTGSGDPSAMPVFIIGMPRSGTTLVEQIIASHPLVHGAGELPIFNEIVSRVTGAGDAVPFSEPMSGIDADALHRIGADYVARLRSLAPDSERVTDKMPSNYFFAGLIHLALPNAKIIHCVRDPIDTCLSCFSKLFVAEQKHTFDLGELGRYYRRYEQLMAHWRRVLPPGRILDVRYEEVVADLDGQARRIIAHCGLPWDDRCLAFHETERPVRTASATQVRQPIYSSAVGRWRVYGQHLDPLLSALGVDATRA